MTPKVAVKVTATPRPMVIPAMRMLTLPALLAVPVGDPIRRFPKLASLCSFFAIEPCPTDPTAAFHAWTACTGLALPVMRRLQRMSPMA
jgi:hypothetical protein